MKYLCKKEIFFWGNPVRKAGRKYEICDNGDGYPTLIGELGECNVDWCTIEEHFDIHSHTEENFKLYENYKLQWMLDHGFTLKDLISELDKLKEENDEDTTIEKLFESWEFDVGFGSQIWPCMEEWLDTTGGIDLQAKKNILMLVGTEIERIIRMHDRDRNISGQARYARIFSLCKEDIEQYPELIKALDNQTAIRYFVMQTILKAVPTEEEG